jgi:hypothetical protein
MYRGAAAFQQQHVPPVAMEPAQALPHPHHPEPAPLVEPDAGLVLGEDAGLHRPDSPSAAGRHATYPAARPEDLTSGPAARVAATGGGSAARTASSRACHSSLGGSN